MAAEEAPYHFVRPAGGMETIWDLFNDFAIYSNVVSVARYEGRAGQPKLRREVLLAALERVVREHYALATTFVERASERNKAKHRVWEARLAQIDLAGVVENVDSAAADTAEGLWRLVEAAHNDDWFPADDPSRARWRVRVINGRHVLFVADHGIADGLSHYAFHRSLLRAVNECERLPAAKMEGRKDWVIAPPELTPAPYWTQDFFVKVSILGVLWDVVIQHVWRFLLGSRLWFADAAVDNRQPKYDERRRHHREARCRTTVFALDLDAEQQGRIVAACKAHGITYTSLLYTLAIGTLATDIYPKAQGGRGSLAVNFRSFATPTQGLDLMVNSVGSTYALYWSLARHRRALGAAASSNVKDDSKNPLQDLDVAGVVALAQACAQSLRRDVQTRQLFNPSLGWSLMSLDKQDVYRDAFPILRLALRNTLLVSNLGPFKSPAGDEKAAWAISDFRFSASATGSTVGSAAPYLNVASMPGGACHISVVMEQGMVPDARMQRFVERLKGRLLCFADHGLPTPSKR